MRSGPGPRVDHGLDRLAVAIVALGVAGIAVSAYLTVAHYAGATLACQESALIDCEAVTTSSYSLVPGTQLPVSVPGLLWSALVVAAGLLALAGRRTRALDVGLALWAAGALLVVLYFVRAEIVVIGRICLWCTAFHAIVLVVLLLAFARLPSALDQDA